MAVRESVHDEDRYVQRICNYSQTQAQATGQHDGGSQSHPYDHVHGLVWHRGIWQGDLGLQLGLTRFSGGHALGQRSRKRKRTVYRTAGRQELRHRHRARIFAFEYYCERNVGAGRPQTGQRCDRAGLV